jgi:hypothetical protein
VRYCLLLLGNNRAENTQNQAELTLNKPGPANFAQPVFAQAIIK